MANDLQPQSKRRRLTPDERVAELLDAAAELVVEEGIADITMEKIASRAKVSKGLVYAYFPNVKALLRQVLIREHHEQQSEQLAAVSRPASFENMARATAHINHRRYQERGLLVERLRGDPEINAVMAERDRKTREAVIDYLSNQVLAHFDLPEDVAILATELIVGPDRRHRPPDQSTLQMMDEVWGAMMVGAMNELVTRYGKKRGSSDE